MTPDHQHRSALKTPTRIDVNPLDASRKYDFDKASRRVRALLKEWEPRLGPYGASEVRSPSAIAR